LQPACVSDFSNRRLLRLLVCLGTHLSCLALPLTLLLFFLSQLFIKFFTECHQFLINLSQSLLKHGCLPFKRFLQLNLGVFNHLLRVIAQMVGACIISMFNKVDQLPLKRMQHVLHFALVSLGLDHVMHILLAHKRNKTLLDLMELLIEVVDVPRAIIFAGLIVLIISEDLIVHLLAQLLVNL